MSERMINADGYEVNRQYKCFDDAIFEAAQHAIDANMTPLQFYKQCFYAYGEALRQAQDDRSSDARTTFRRLYREMARKVDPGDVEGGFHA